MVCYALYACLWLLQVNSRINKCISDKLDRRGKPPIGKHFKEHKMDTVTVKFCASELEKHKDKKAGRKKEDYVPRLLVLGYGCEKEVIKSKNEAQVSRKANERLLLIFCDIRNCKFKINNGTFPPKCHFEFSETPGYTGTEMCEKIKALAESKGYKFKIIEGEGKNAIFTDRYGSNAC